AFLVGKDAEVGDLLECGRKELLAVAVTESDKRENARADGAGDLAINGDAGAGDPLQQKAHQVFISSLRYSAGLRRTTSQRPVRSQCTKVRRSSFTMYKHGSRSSVST